MLVISEFGPRLILHHPVEEELMLRDNDNSRMLLEKLSKELESTKARLENKTKTVDRLLDQLDLRNRDIQQLKTEAQRRCESKCIFHPASHSKLTLGKIS